MRDMQEEAKGMVVNYFNDRVEKTDGVKIDATYVYVVWFSKTLQNWKALLSTNITDGMYYEITHNGDNHETYLDAYKKFDNILIHDEQSQAAGMTS